MNAVMCTRQGWGRTSQTTVQGENDHFWAPTHVNIYSEHKKYVTKQGNVRRPKEYTG